MTTTPRALRLTAIALLTLLAGVGAHDIPRQIAAPFTARVTAVVDGDTIDVVTAEKRTVRIRLDGIDCPEAGQPFSNVARNFTRQMAFDKTVTVRPIDTDRYGRTVARVVVDGQELSVALVEAGLAWVFASYSQDRMLEAAEARARGAKRGGWVDPAFGPRTSTAASIPPATSTTPRALASAPTGPFHGNKSSRVYHRPGCRNYSCKNCTAVFTTEADAQRAGYRPSGDCLR